MSELTKGFMGIIIGGVVGAILGAKWVGRQYDLHCEKIERTSDKFSDTCSVLTKWIKIHQSGKKLDSYFEKYGYKKISIYGMNEMAYALISELKDSDVSVDYCIDRNADNLFLEIKCLKPDEKLPEVDLCVIALPELFEEISKSLSNNLQSPMVSIEDVVWGV